MKRKLYKAVGYVRGKYGQPELRIRRGELMRLAQSAKEKLGAMSFAYDTENGLVKVTATAPILG